MRVFVKFILSLSLVVLVLGLSFLDASAEVRRNLLIKRPGYYPGLQQELLGPGAARLCAGKIVPDAGPGKNRGPEIHSIGSVTLVRAGTQCSLNPVVSTVGDSFYVGWGSDCVQPGDFVILSITAPGPWNPGGAAWRDQFGSTVDVAAVSIVAAPGLDPRGGALLAGALGLLGTWALRRRRLRPDAN